MLMLDEKSIGLYESIIEVENMNPLKKANELAKISQQKKEIIIFKYIYGTILMSYLGGVIYWFGLKKNNFFTNLSILSYLI